VVTSVQTKSILDDLPDKDLLDDSLPEPDLKRAQRVILRFNKRPSFGHWIMLFIWQFPSMTMSYAWCTFLGGLTMYMSTPFIRHEAWSDRCKVGAVAVSHCCAPFMLADCCCVSKCRWHRPHDVPFLVSLRLHKREGLRTLSRQYAPKYERIGDCSCRCRRAKMGATYNTTRV
jgi:hypothetical protein